jgi:LuxR family maltose regulon positive regulatory protein
MTDSLHDSLLLTKLNRPLLSRDVIHRPRLLKQLQSPSNLILVVAPAGYGKTTLVDSWLESTPMPSAWLSLDESDNDFSTFIHYLIVAIQTRFPLIGSRTMQLFATTTSPSISSVSNSLTNELSSIDQEFILVIDDYHLIHNRVIHQLLADLTRRPPPSLHLVLVGRNDPALPLPGLRARGLVTELRTSDLRFTLDEIAIFFRDALEINVTDEELAILAEKTEGWPVSLRLAAVYFQHSGSSSLIGSNQSGGNRYLIDYMVNEITTLLPGDVKDFLMKTSILDQLCGSLCDAVMGFDVNSGRSQKQLEWLHHSDLFTTSVENALGWYRYHHLFRQFLFSELKLSLPPDEVAAFYLRASSWFESQGFLKEAIAHAFSAGDVNTAVAIFVRHRRDITNLDNWQALQQLLSLFPREIINSHPELKLAEVTLYIYQNQYSQMAALIDEAESMLAKSHLPKADRGRLEGEMAARRAAVAYWEGNLSLSGSLAQLALDKLPQEWWQPRVQARLYLSVDFQRQGNLDRALDVLTNTGEPDLGPVYQVRLLASACFACWMAADLPQLERTSLRILEKYSDLKSNSAGAAPYFLGVISLCRNDLERAVKYLQPLVMQPHLVQALVFLHSSIALALTYQFRGESEKALDLMDVIETFTLEIGAPFALSDVAALKAELAMLRGNLNQAVRWADSYQMSETIRLPFSYAPPITYIKVLIAQNTPASLKKAARVLSRLKKNFTTEHQTRWLIDVLALRAMVYHVQGDETKALVDLEKSVRLAEPGGFIRNFVDLGKPIKPLLAKLMKQGVSPAYLAGILSAIEAQTTQPLTGEATKAATLSTLQTAFGLSKREQEVLRFLDKRYTDTEIAETLIISKETVRSHIAHLSDKLGVRGRRAIVQVARDLGLLD